MKKIVLFVKRVGQYLREVHKWNKVLAETARQNRRATRRQMV